MKRLQWFGCLVIVVLLMGVAGCEDGGNGGLSISPGSVSFDASNIMTIFFTVNNGVPPYSWSVDNSNLGSLSASGDTAVYTSTSSIGENRITVTDATASSASATIEQF